MTLAQGAGLNETVVGVAVIAVAGLLFALVLKWKSGEDMTKALAVLGTLFGSVIAGTGTYFFTKPAIEEAQRGRAEAESKTDQVLDKAFEAVEELKDAAEPVAQAWTDMEKALAGVPAEKRGEATRMLRADPKEFAIKYLPTLPKESQPAAGHSLDRILTHSLKVKKVEEDLKGFRRK